MNEVALPSHRGRWLGQKLLRAFWQIIGPLQDKNYLRLKYFSLTGRFPDLRNPRLFTEKLQVRKLLDRNPLYPVMVDKHAAKALIADRVGCDHVIDTYWVGRDLEDVDWDKIPLPAVVKPTHGSGSSVFLRTRDDIASLLRDNPAPGWLSTHHDRINREWAYSQVVPQVIIERMLVAGADVPDDYRFFVFSGKVAMIEVRMRRQDVAYECYFTPDWDRMQVASGYYPPYPHEVSRPARLDDMLAVACKIARDIDFVRTDLYCIDERIYVGELTLYPGGGFAGASPKQLEAFLGDRWTLKLDLEANDMRPATTDMELAEK